jgi:hypothetical protein
MTEKYKIANIVPAYNMCFNKDEKVVARFSWDKGYLEAEGDLEYGAEKLFELLKGMVDDYIKNKTQDLENKLSIAKTQNSIYKKNLNR